MDQATQNPLSSTVAAFSVDYVEDGVDKSPKNAKTVGGMPTISSLIPLSWILSSGDGKEVEVKNSELSTVFLLLNSMIGSGIVVQAYAFSQTGIVLCIFEYLIIAAMNYAGVDMLLKCAEATQVYDYSKLAERILGRNGTLAVDISIVFGAIGSLLSYILIIGTVLTQVVGHCDGWYCNVAFLTILPVTLFTVPLCLLRDFGHLAIASYISIAVIAASVLLVIIGGPIVSEDDEIANYRMGSFICAIKTVGNIVFALGYITATFHAYNAMADKRVATFARASRTTTIIGAVMCFSTGLAGYLSFGDDVKSNVIENFTGTVGSVFKVALVAHLILYIPGDFVIFRASLLKLQHLTVSDLSDFAFITLSLSCIAGVTFVAVMLQVFLSSTDNLAVVVDITGGVAGSMLYFVVPALCALKQFPDNRELYIRSVLLLLFGSTIMALCIASTAM